jgi:hypothetical protein
MKNTTEVSGGKPIAVLLQSMSGVSAINPLVAFLRHPRTKERGAILLFCPGHHTRPPYHACYIHINLPRESNVSI